MLGTCTISTSRVGDEVGTTFMTELEDGPMDAQTAETKKLCDVIINSKGKEKKLAALSKFVTFMIGFLLSVRVYLLAAGCKPDVQFA